MAELTKLLTPEAIDVRPPSAGRSRYVTTTPEPGSLMAEHHHMARWVQPVLVIMAVWLATSPPILGYESLALTVSDLITAVVLAGLAWLAFQGRMWAGWAIAGVGIWLLFAPLLFSVGSSQARIHPGVGDCGVRSPNNLRRATPPKRPATGR